MDAKMIAEYKKRLEKERALLMAEIKQSEKPQISETIERQDPDDGSDESEEVGNQLAIAHDLKNRLDEIDIALGKIYAGTYGNCEKCGKPIEKEILDIDPESRLCKHCKSGK